MYPSQLSLQYKMQSQLSPEAGLEDVLNARTQEPDRRQ